MRIIFFDIDCLRPDHLGCYGYPRPTSPSIDAIAREGVRFDRYFCANSPCLPSRAGWASGRYGIRNGIVSNHGAGARFQIQLRNYVGPEPDNQMLMRHLRAHGYDTVSFSNFADRHNAFWFMCGWTEYHTPNLKGGSETAQEVNEALLPWLRQNAQREDYLLHINYWDVHRCYKMDASWADRFRGHPVPQAWPDEQAIRAHQSIDGPFTAGRQFVDGISPYPLMPGSVRSRADVEHMITGYDAAIAYVDHHVEQVLEELGRQGVLEDAVVVITADHGDAFGEHGVYSDHVCADECIHHIPLIVRWPGRTPRDQGCDALTCNVDLPATLCDLLDVPAPADWDGISFREQVEGHPGGGREALVWDHALYSVQRAVRTDRHLMIRTYDDYGYGFDPVQLYDLRDDPYQTVNLAHDEPAVLQQCEHLMGEWVQGLLAKDGWRTDPLVAVLQERSAADSVHEG
jgi:arylsulfatase A-like enzyme